MGSNKIAIATRADKNNMKFYENFKNSLRKFHGEDEVDLLLWDEEKIKQYNDNEWFYRASPTIGREIIDKYELILLMDSDQIVMGKLDYIFKADYDIGTVLNINRVDPARYGMISFQGIAPNEYYNNGLVAIRNTPKGREFLDEWYRLCHTKYFDRFQYREQDVLNIVAHYGDYNVLCFDDYDVSNNYYAWHGLVSKGEWHRAEKRGEDVIIPKGEDKYPDHDMSLKIIHFAGGKDEKKGNYRIHFSEPMIKYIDWLVSDTKEAYGV